MIVYALMSLILIVVPTAPPPGGYATCDQAAEDGQSNILQGSPGYRPSLDRDGDGVACESMS